MRKFLSALALALPLLAQNAALPPDPHQRFLDASGRPLAGGKVYTCQAGLACPGNPLATYTDATATVQNPNPVILDTGGYASLWIGTGSYKFVAQNASGVQQWTQDNIALAGGGLVTGTLGATGTSGNWSVPGTLSVAGASSLSSLSASGAITSPSVNQVFYAAQYGGTDLGAQINAAMAACPATGCKIILPQGSYSVTTQILVSKAGVWLEGLGRGATTLVQAFTGDLIRVAADNFTLSGVTLNGNGVSTGWSLVHGLNASRGRIFQCEFIDTRAPAFNTMLGVRIEGTSSGTPSNDWEVHHNSFYSIPWIAVSVANNANRNSIHHNHILNGGESFDFNGVGAGAQIYDNSFSDNYVSGGFGDAFLESSAGSLVRGNVFDYSSASTTFPIIAVHVAASGVQKRSIISGNQFRGGAGSGNCLYIYDNSAETLVDGNIFDSCGRNGIYASTGAGSVTYLSITNNIFRNNGSADANGGYSAIAAQQINSHALAEWTVANNVAYDDQATRTQTYGFSVTGTGAIFDSYVQGNDFSRNKTGAFSFSGGATLHSSTAIGPNRETASAITHQDPLILSSTLQLGAAGGTFSSLARYTASVTPTSLSAGTCYDISVSPTGWLANTSVLAVTPPTALGNSIAVQAYGTGSTSAVLHFCNTAGVTVTPPSGTYTLVGLN